MGFFIVHLKEGSELLKIEADKFYIEDGVFFVLQRRRRRKYRWNSSL